MIVLADPLGIRVQAATYPAHSIERMIQVAAFAVSSYSGTNNRMMKPFNPLLGETFEFQYPEQNWRGIAEKVCSFAHALIVYISSKDTLSVSAPCFDRLSSFRSNEHHYNPLSVMLDLM